ncbi:MAG: hypothetical protein C0622_00660 [Desulfuromonas sp.]|nr:MAG: hypothetical protein C0622_00660 [Desulfuromonas sp.]
MIKKLNYEVKEKIVSLAGACFWFWNSFYSFLDSCGVSKRIQSQYPKETFNKYQVMRNVLERLEEKGEVETLNNIVSGFYRLNNAIDRDNLDESKAKGLLKEFKNLVGNDPIETEIKKKEQVAKRETAKQKIEENINFKKRLDQLNSRFMGLFSLSDMTPQQRGFKLEELFFDLLQLNEFEFTPPYKTTDGEQIDGHFKYEKFDYLVEIKWTEEVTKQKDLSIFDGKIRGKAQSTRGVFLSASGFDDNAINKFTGDSPRIIFLNGEDLALVLNGSFTLFDAMKAKVDALVRYGNTYLKLREI